MSSPRSISARLCCVLTILCTSFLIAPPEEAEAFCGFYVSGAGEEMFNNATMVVMMREGTKTVLSMRNNYEGPPEDFAMVIPVPQVLEEEDVKTLKNDLFDRVDKLAAPRLVEYWERDPCYQPPPRPTRAKGGAKRRSAAPKKSKAKSAPDLGVTVEAEFDVGEYNIAVLSAKESTGLETWLTSNDYKIPEGAAPVLKPYVEQGLYFFVARVDPKKIEFNKEGMAELSPLRFAYDSKDFFLPVRLGLLNAKGHQDLIVHILAKNARYEVANYNNVTIPTNLIVKDSVKEQFANFYVSLFDRVLEENPGSVVTEYSWGANSCDPCPGPVLNSNDIMTLGGDIVIKNDASDPFDSSPTPTTKTRPAKPTKKVSRRRGKRRRFRRPPNMGWTLTRLHARYTEKDLTEDLVFRKADAIVGGRGTPVGLDVIEKGAMDEQSAQPSSQNNFQGRYIMLHEWEGEITCEFPQRGIWGGPPSSKSSSSPGTAQNTAFVKREAALLDKSLITKELPKVAIGAKEEPPAKTESQPAAPPKDAAAPDMATSANMTRTPAAQPKTTGGCAQSSGGTPAPLSLAGIALLGTLWLRRRKKSGTLR